MLEIRKSQNSIRSDSLLAFAGSGDGGGGPLVVPLTLHLKARSLDAMNVDIRHSVKAVISENGTISPFSLFDVLHFVPKRGFLIQS